MANNFQTVKLKSSSEKFNLIRIEPARAIEGDVTLVSGTLYSATFEFPNVSQVKVDGVSYTKVMGTPSSGEFRFNESTKLIELDLGVSLTTEILVIFYRLFFTQKDKARITFEDPLDDATTAKLWEPRVNTDPMFEQTLKDVTEGFLSFGSSNIILNNEDGFFQKYLGDNDSFANKAITIWLGLNSVENVSLVFKGQINLINIADKVSLEFFDEFSVLNKTFFSNGSYLNSTFNSTKFVNLHPSKENSPIRKLYAEVSTYSVINEGTAAGLHRIDGERLLEGTCVGFSTTISTTTNRVWGTVLNEGDGGLQTDTISAVDHSDPNFSLLTYGVGKKYRIGDTLQVAGSKYVRVLFVDTGANQIKTTKDATITASSSTNRPGISAIVISQATTFYYPLFGRDYTVSYGGNPNDVIQITFTNNFEATLAMLPLNPDIDVVKYRAWADTGKSLLHGDVVKDILESSGLLVNAASITAANLTALKTNFYVPTFEESSFKPFSSHLEDILSSTLGYLSLNDSLEFIYALFDAPSASETSTDRNILLGSYNQTIDYNDIRNSIVPENVHEILELGLVNAGLESPKATFLHEVTVEKTYNHVLEDTSRMSSVLNFLAERKAFFRYTTKVNPDVIIGDDFSIDRLRIIGNSPRDVTTIAVSKNATETTITGIDLLGL